MKTVQILSTTKMHAPRVLSHSHGVPIHPLTICPIPSFFPILSHSHQISFCPTPSVSLPLYLNPNLSHSISLPFYLTPILSDSHRVPFCLTPSVSLPLYLNPNLSHSASLPFCPIPIVSHSVSLPSVSLNQAPCRHAHRCSHTSRAHALVPGVTPC